MAKIKTIKGKNLNVRREISMHFRIKVYSSIDNGKSLNSLRGYSGLINLIGRELAYKFMTAAIMGTEDKVSYKLRRGIKITFYSK